MYISGVRVLPAIPLRGLVVFPHMVLHFDAGREKTLSAIMRGMETDQLVVLVTQRDARKNELDMDDMYEVGTLSRIKQMLKLPGDSVRVLVEGIRRVRILDYLSTSPFFEVEAETLDSSEPEDEIAIQAMRRLVNDKFEEYARLSGKIAADTMLTVEAVQTLDQFTDLIAGNLLTRIEDKQKVLECADPAERLSLLLKLLCRETEILRIEGRITSQVRKQIEKSQREYFLREQIKAIQKELGDENAPWLEADKYEERLKTLEMSDETRAKIQKEIDRFSHLIPGSHELAGLQNWIEWVLDMPWQSATADDTRLGAVARVLDADHYGLKKIKERVLEFLAVKNLTQALKGPILCFVGPPGTGKTSISSSLARAMGRKFVRASLGGMRDEAEIRGHRRTYIGAIPGRIIAAMKQAGSNNPVILLDEIDKMSSDFRGDPASALLEVLDSEQNHAFRDSYLEVPVDLSNVLFIATANTKSEIPKPLLDRMDVIELPSYTSEEKLQIARRHLVKKQMEQNGVKKGALRLPEAVLSEIINTYTREAGVRNLERRIAAICRKAAKEIDEGAKAVSITKFSLVKYLGEPTYHKNKLNDLDEVGIATGLAWTQAGGEILFVETAPLPGTGKFELTGQLGDVMKESAHAAMSVLRARAEELGIDPDFYKNKDIHVHLPEGATPKDGPSAGVALCASIASALSGVPVRRDIAMTGEITLRGKVLPVGGLVEKILAARSAGIFEVILPKDNAYSLQDLPDYVKSEMSFHYVGSIDEVFDLALLYRPQPFIAHASMEKVHRLAEMQ